MATNHLPIGRAGKVQLLKCLFRNLAAKGTFQVGWIKDLARAELVTIIASGREIRSTDLDMGQDEERREQGAECGFRWV
jgi:hypothetical protein